MVILLCFVFPFRKLFTFKLGIQNIMEISSTLWSMTPVCRSCILVLFGIYQFEGYCIFLQLQLVQMLDFYCRWAAAGNLISVTGLNFQPKTTWWGMRDEICRPDIGASRNFKASSFPNCPFQSDQIVIILMLIIFGVSKVEDTLHCPPLLFVNLVTETFGLEFFQPWEPKFWPGAEERTKPIAANKCYSTQSGCTDVYASTCQQ